MSGLERTETTPSGDGSLPQLNSSPVAICDNLCDSALGCWSAAINRKNLFIGKKGHRGFESACLQSIPIVSGIEDAENINLSIVQ